MSLVFKSLLVVLLAINTYAVDELYFLPQDAKKVEKKIEKLLKNSNSSIDIAMYNFKHKKFRKALKKAHKNGVEISLYLDQEKAKKTKLNFINSKTFDEKMHIKALVVDKKTVVFGSANWKKESFGKTLEVIYISDDPKIVDQFNKIFVKLSKYNR